jgi:hypothetical protein
MKSSAVIVLAMLVCPSASAFSFTEMERQRQSLHTMSAEADDSRRGFFTKSGAAAFSLASGLGLNLLAPLPANAAAVDKVNARLKA